MRATLSFSAESFPESSTTRRVLADLTHLDDEHSAGPEHGELWLVSYADLMTLLFGFFVMLYADAGRMQDMKDTFQNQSTPLAQKSRTETEAEAAQLGERQQSELENIVLKERIADLESKLKVAQAELSVKRASQEHASWTKKLTPEGARLLFKMPCRFCANFSNYIDSGVAGHLQASQTDVVITHVTRGGPADHAGLRAGDIIENINGHIPTERGLFESFAVGQEVPVNLRRFGQKMTISVVLDSIGPEALQALRSSPAEESMVIGAIAVSRIGPKERIMHYIPSEIEGALVTRSCETCGYLRDRLQVGDVIVSINGEWVRTPEQLSQIWVGPAVVEVWRKGSRSYDLVRLAPGAGPA
ncbi:MAG: PDZ domain-containing protein [Bdellovibrionales bacterium]|nr:PDZ domain-containing protein [Bdellovibrionales bacterium]